MPNTIMMYIRCKGGELELLIKRFYASLTGAVPLHRIYFLFRSFTCVTSMSKNGQDTNGRVTAVCIDLIQKRCFCQGRSPALL